MTRRLFLLGLFAVLMLFGLATLGAARVDAADRPNFIIFIADDMAWDDCGAYGHKTIRTPNIDRLAREGMRFDRAFLTCSSCSPSRSSIMTGRYPHSTGAEQLHWPLPKAQVIFPEKLRSAGYYTASAGKWHLGSATLKKFDQVTQGRNNPWLKTMKERPKDQPFFLWMAFFDPHRPYQANTIPRPHRPEEVVVPPYLPDAPDTRTDLALYYDEIARLDGVVGEVLAELRKQGEADNTFVLFMSDNGRPFPRCKTTVYDSGVQTPWIVRFPGRVKPGSTCERLVSSVDIAPTILDLAGVKQPETFQGHSISPLLKDPTASVRDYIFAEHNWHDYAAHGRAVRSTRYKYIRNDYYEVAGTPPADAVRSLTFQEMRRLRDAGKLTPDQMTCFTKPRPREELYDTQSDPHELRNLADNPASAKVLGVMRAALARWQRKTHDGVPKVRSHDEFDRETGDRLKNNQPRDPIADRQSRGS